MYSSRGTAGEIPIYYSFRIPSPIDIPAGEIPIYYSFRISSPIDIPAEGQQEIPIYYSFRIPSPDFFCLSFILLLLS